MLPVRIAQALFAIIVLGLSADGMRPAHLPEIRMLNLSVPVASWWNAFYSDISPSQINFLLFCSIWTCAVAVPYLALSPRFFPIAAHKYAILAAEAVTMIFWFAGFLAAAVLLAGFNFCNGTVCGAARGAIVFGAFEWYGHPPSESAGTTHDIHSVDTDLGQTT